MASWTTENPDDSWRDRIHKLMHKGTLYSLEYIYKGDPEVGWWLFLDDDEEGEPLSVRLERAKEKVEEMLWSSGSRKSGTK